MVYGNIYINFSKKAMIKGRSSILSSPFVKNPAIDDPCSYMIWSNEWISACRNRNGGVNLKSKE